MWASIWAGLKVGPRGWLGRTYVRPFQILATYDCEAQLIGPEIAGRPKIRLRPHVRQCSLAVFARRCGDVVLLSLFFYYLKLCWGAFSPPNPPSGGLVVALFASLFLFLCWGGQALPKPLPVIGGLRPPNPLAGLRPEVWTSSDPLKIVVTLLFGPEIFTDFWTVGMINHSDLVLFVLLLVRLRLTVKISSQKSWRTKQVWSSVIIVVCCMSKLTS